jgi:hypothetical protein
MQALIHEKSKSVPLPKLDIFAVPPTQNQIDKTLAVDFRPITSFQGSPQIQFEVPSRIDEYVEFDKMAIHFKVKLQKLTSIKESKDFDMISPVNYLLHSMIKQVDIFIGDTQITQSSPTYAYRAYFEAFFGFSLDMKNSHLSSALWFNDEDDKDDAPIKQRSKYLKDYKELDLMGRLHSDLTFQGKNLVGGCRLTIRILFNDPKFYLMAAGHSPHLEILDATLFVKYAKLSQQTLVAHNKVLETSRAKYPHCNFKFKQFVLQKGSIDASIENAHSGQLPRRIIIAMVKNEALNGDYGLNPFNFRHFDLIHLSVYVGGEQFPNKGFNPDFKNKLYVKEFYSLYEGLDMVDCDPTFKITRENFADGNTFFCVNFAPDLTNGPGTVGHVSRISYGSLRVAMRFANPLPENISVCMFLESDKILEIDNQRNVYLDLY